MKYFIKNDWNELDEVSREDIGEYARNHNYCVIVEKLDGAVMIVRIER